MEEVYETIEYRGMSINIYRDDLAESPDRWKDENLFLVAFHRDFSVDRKEFNIDLCREISAQMKASFNKVYTEDDYCEGYEYEAQETLKKYHVFGLEAYIHSGVRLALSYEGNFCDRQWDVSQLGLVFVSKEEFKTRKKAIDIARSLIETWNQYLSGDIYGFQAVDSFSGSEIDSCWGFYGHNWKENGLLEHVENAIDYELERRRKEKQVKTKTYIKYRVPLERRV